MWNYLKDVVNVEKKNWNHDYQKEWKWLVTRYLLL